MSNEDRRWGRSRNRGNIKTASAAGDVRNALARVGPDLKGQEGDGVRATGMPCIFRSAGNIGEIAPMPRYPWLFDGQANQPNVRGLALITYIQWLGSWHETYPDYEDYTPAPFKTAAAMQPSDPKREQLRKWTTCIRRREFL
ncbi:MAG: hypothetical protein U0872_00705 [Planctomycetaceae bacterium]